MTEPSSFSGGRTRKSSSKFYYTYIFYITGRRMVGVGVGTGILVSTEEK